MSASDKIHNSAQGLRGRTTEAVGKATHDHHLIAKGKADRASASARKVVEDIKVAFTH